MPGETAQIREGTVRSVARALGILGTFERPPHCWGISELSDQVGLSKGTVHLLVKSLVAAGFLEQDAASRKYRLGGAVHRLAAALPSRDDVRTVARQHLTKLTAVTSLPSYLVTLVGDSAVLVEKAEPQLPLMLVLQVGIKLPLHCSALGKLLLAYLPDARREALLAEMEAAGLSEVTPHTITDMCTLRGELAAIPAGGHALDREESLPGLFCVAVPVRDGRGEVVAAVAVGALIPALSEQTYPTVLPVLQQCANAISAGLGHRGTAR